MKHTLISIAACMLLGAAGMLVINFAGPVVAFAVGFMVLIAAVLVDQL